MMANYFTLAATGFALGAITTPIAAQEGGPPMLDRGTREIAVAGRLELPGLDEVNYDLAGSYGYFFRDGWEIGLRVNAADFGGIDRFDITGFTEYNFRRNRSWVPFVGGALGLATVELDDNLIIGTDLDDDDGWVFDVEGGIKWFLRPYMAISTSISFKLAANDIFAVDDEIEDNLTSFKIGMRYYF